MFNVLGILESVAAGLSAIGLVVVLVLVITGADGRARLFGILGSVLMLLSVLRWLGYAVLVTPIQNQIATDSMMTILVVQGLLGNVLTGAGVSALAYAIVLAGRRRVS